MQVRGAQAADPGKIFDRQAAAVVFVYVGNKPDKPFGITISIVIFLRVDGIEIQLGKQVHQGVYGKGIVCVGGVFHIKKKLVQYNVKSAGVFNMYELQPLFHDQVVILPAD